MDNKDILRPIEEEIAQWIEYEKNKPNCPYEKNRELWDIYRKNNDTDCQLTGNNLNADTIFSLWLPLRFTFVKLNGYTIGKIEKEVWFLERLIDNLPEYLPVDKPVINKLSKLFELGITRANVMLLPDRAINTKRGNKPYYDYMPHFLNQCFEGGCFSQYFHKNDEILKEWLKAERLEMFFEDEQITKDKVKDLADTGNVKCNIPSDLEKMFDRCIYILEDRGKFYSDDYMSKG